MQIKPFFLTGLIISSNLLLADTLSFQHHDWQVSCDNTNYCRIAGYAPDEAHYKASLLLERKAGKNQKVKAQVQLAYFGEEDEKALKTLSPIFKLEMIINHKSYGSVTMKKNNFIATLSPKQTKAILNALKRKSTITWKNKKYSWELSDKGASAVLLKADEFQKRIGTTTALYKKGNKNEQNVLSPKNIPIIYAKALRSEKTIALEKSSLHQLKKELVLPKNTCDNFAKENNKLNIYKLSSNKLLVSQPCWMAAYNEGSAYWVVNDKSPFKPKLITTDGSDYYLEANNIGTIMISHKGRGIGDCWFYKSFVWTGQTFEVNSIGSTGLCRAIAGGGAWDMPTFVSKIEKR